MFPSKSMATPPISHGAGRIALQNLLKSLAGVVEKPIGMQHKASAALEVSLNVRAGRTWWSWIVLWLCALMTDSFFPREVWLPCVLWFGQARFFT